MRYSDTLLPEFDQEMASTRLVLDRLPEDKLDWKAHPKSNTIGWNANHLAEIPGWVAGTINETSWDISPPGGEAYQAPALASKQAILEVFDKNVAEGRAAIADLKDDAEMAKPWSLLSGGQVIFTMPRATVIRSFVLNHLVHHRAILCVYLRLNGLAVPGMYGPSGDE